MYSDLRIIAAMLCKNEDWCLGATIPATLEWCDEIVLLDDCSYDRTPDIAKSFKNVHYYRRDHIHAMWDEMEARQELADLVFQHNPDVFALVDADEMLPIPFRKTIRSVLGYMDKDTCLSPSALNPWNSLDVYRCDDCQWTRNHWSTAIKIGDVPLVWKSQKDGYTHHHRVPNGIKETWVGGDDMGNIHLQFANYPRRLAKHAWYQMTEWIRWGKQGRSQSSKGNLNKKYSAALNETGLKTKPIPGTWFRKEEKENIDLSSPGWYQVEMLKMFNNYGRDEFDGLNMVVKFFEEFS